MVLASECDKEVESILNQQRQRTPGADISPTPPIYSPISGQSTGGNLSSASKSTCSPDRANTSVDTPNASPKAGPSNAFCRSNDDELNESTSGEESVDSEDMLLMCKKRKSDPKTWKRNLIKDRANKGLGYVNINNVQVRERAVKSPCKNTCKLKCADKITAEQRTQIFNSFYKNGLKTQQWDYILKNVVDLPKRNHRINSKRTVTKHYFLTVSSCEATENQNRIRVCRTFFLNTLAVSKKTVETAQNKHARAEAIISPDQRGRYKRSFSPNTIGVKTSVIEHIRKYRLTIAVPKPVSCIWNLT
jgi:hypothetical protein